MAGGRRKSVDADKQFTSVVRVLAHEPMLTASEMLMVCNRDETLFPTMSIFDRFMQKLISEELVRVRVINAKKYYSLVPDQLTPIDELLYGLDVEE